MVYKELNRYFEIIGLLYSCRHFDLMTNDNWKNAALEHGIDSTALINKFGALQKKYVNAFKKNMSFVPGATLTFSLVMKIQSSFIYFKLYALTIWNGLKMIYKV